MKKLIAILFLLLAPSAYAVTTEDLISYWKMDETSGTREDIHGTQDLTDNNTVLYGTGISGNGADLEWSNSEYLSHADSDDLGLGSDEDFTISVWINSENLTSYAYRPIFSKCTATTTTCEYLLYYYYVGTDPNNKMIFSIGNGTTYTNVQETFSSSGTFTWFHILAWHDKTANKIYLRINGDSTPAEASWTGGTYAGGASSFAIGTFTQASGHYFDGIIDEVGFWKRILTSTEQDELYNSGTGTFYDDFTEPGGGGGYAHSQGYVIG